MLPHFKRKRCPSVSGNFYNKLFSVKKKKKGTDYHKVWLVNWKLYKPVLKLYNVYAF